MSNKNLYRILLDDDLFHRMHEDRLAEAEFYRRYKIRVKSLIRHYQLNSLEREDLIQEGMIGLFRAIETYKTDQGARFYTYAMVCIRNRIKNGLHEIYRNKGVELDESLWEEIPSDSNPEADTIRSEIMGRYKKTVEKLKPEEKKVLEYYLDGKSYRETAELLAISTKKVDNILLKIRKKLSFTLNKNHDPEH